MIERLGAVEERKHFIRSFVVQNRSGIGIDVGHHEVDLRLGELVKRGAFGKYIPYKLMVFL